MIITITGKPCSGKGSVSRHFCSAHNFDYRCTGDMLRALATKLGFKTVLDFQKSPQISEGDKMIDEATAEFGSKHLSDDVVFDSRLAWHFIPKSFKVFIDVDWDTAALRLFEASRENEPASSPAQAKLLLIDRWNEENFRYQRIYGIDNLDMSHYDLVISSTNRTIEDISNEIYARYIEFLSKNK